VAWWAVEQQDAADEPRLEWRLAADLGVLRTDLDANGGPEVVDARAVLLVAAVTIEILLDVSGAVRAFLASDYVALPGAVIRTVLMGVLGALAIWRRARLARSIFAGLLFLTAAGSPAFVAMAGSHGSLFSPVIWMSFAGYWTLGAAATIGRMAPGC
jgi:hypothetical protein